ncbi:MAG: universal stress protein [Thermoleophilia bacterium]
MTHDLLAEQPDGPILLCAGTDPAAAARLAEAALPLLADRAAVVVSIWQPPPPIGYEAVREALYDDHAELRAGARHAAADAAGAACEVLDRHGLDVTRRVHGEDRAPWRILLDIADEVDAAVIVAATTEDAEARPGTLGREARGLAHRSHRPLLLLTPGAPAADPGATALFAYDGSAPADHAIQAAAQLLRPRPALVASVWRSAAYTASAAMLAVPDEVARKGAAGLDEAARHEAEAHAQHAAAQLRDAGWSCDTAAVRTARSIAGAIIVAAEDHDAAVIVTGTRGRSRIAAVLLGSTAEGIVRHAGLPVLLVPPTGEEH